MDDKSDNIQFEQTFSEVDPARQLFGEHNSNLQRIEDALGVKINARGNTVFIQGDTIAANLVQNILRQLYGLLIDNYPLYPNDIDYAIRVLSEDDSVMLCGNMIWFLESGLREQAKRIWQWLWRLHRFQKVW